MNEARHSFITWWRDQKKRTPNEQDAMAKAMMTSKSEFDDYEWFGKGNYAVYDKEEEEDEKEPAPSKKAAPAPTKKAAPASTKKKGTKATAPKKAAAPKKAPPAPVTTDKKKRPEGLPANVVYPNQPRREGLRERKKK